MQHLADNELLAEYLEKNSEEAFATLVARHINKVYSVALRHVGNPHQAEEITQAVFIILLRKARTLRRGTIISGWLYHTARLTAVTFVRSEIRRARREQEACMETLLSESDENAWQQMAPLLDDAVAKLGATERNAVVLRFFDGKSMREVGAGLGISEDTAAKRVSRAVHKLRAFFAKRGVVLSTTAICGAISANSVQSAPAAFSSSVAAVAVNGSSFTATTSALVGEAMDALAWLKVKMALAAAGISLLAVGGVTSTLVFDKPDATAASILHRCQERYSGLSSYSDTWRTVAYLGSTQLFDGLVYSNRTMLARPLLYRIESIVDAKPSASAAIWSAGDGDFWSISAGQLKKYNFDTITGPRFMPEFHVLFPSTPIACAFFPKGDWDSLPALAKAKDLARWRDDFVGTNHCYTVSATTEAPVFHITLWIGKDDFLIHQLRFAWVTGAATDRRAGANADSLPARGGTTNTVIKTHENIVVNGTMAAAEFVRPWPPKFAMMPEREMRADDPRYLDLDSGEFVATHPPGDLFWANVESDLQARAGMNMAVISVANAKWQTASAEEVSERLNGASPQKQVRIGGSESKLEPGSKRTWFFKTSEGSIGVLQILPHNELLLFQDRAGELQTLPRHQRPGSVVIRWKLVQMGYCLMCGELERHTISKHKQTIQNARMDGGF
jgi:RNA polymerase sigma factor (sigma-70 family)